jgi:hypothetical protein
MTITTLKYFETNPWVIHATSLILYYIALTIPTRQGLWWHGYVHEKNLEILKFFHWNYVVQHFYINSMSYEAKNNDKE